MVGRGAPVESVGVTGRRRARIVVALPEGMRAHYSAPGGDGRMWSRVVAELPGRGATVRHLDPARPARFGRRPDVWLSSGHDGPVDADGPVVAHLHEAPWLEPDDVHALDPVFRARLAERSQAASDRATAVITPSEFARRQVIDAHGAPPAKVHAVAHGVDAAVFHPEAAEAGRRLVGRSGCSAPYVAFVSTVHPRKNLPVLKEAMGLLGSAGLPHALVMVVAPAADRADSAELMRRACQPVPGLAGGTFAMNGLPEADLAAVMAAAAAVCVPSRSEGFGLVALEAMAAGTPVVAARRGALPEVVGPAGLVVEPTAEDLAGALERVLTDGDLGAHLAGAGLARSRQLTWGASAAGWLEVLRLASGTAP